MYLTVDQIIAKAKGEWTPPDVKKEDIKEKEGFDLTSSQKEFITQVRQLMDYKTTSGDIIKLYNSIEHFISEGFRFTVIEDALVSWLSTQRNDESEDDERILDSLYGIVKSVFNLEKESLEAEDKTDSEKFISMVLWSIDAPEKCIGGLFDTQLKLKERGCVDYDIYKEDIAVWLSANGLASRYADEAEFDRMVDDIFAVSCKILKIKEEVSSMSSMFTFDKADLEKIMSSVPDEGREEVRDYLNSQVELTCEPDGTGVGANAHSGNGFFYIGTSPFEVWEIFGKVDGDVLTITAIMSEGCPVYETDEHDVVDNFDEDPGYHFANGWKVSF